MAISKDKKNTLVADLTKLLSEAKLTAYANYQGLSVAELEELRHSAREQGVKIKIVKNRLVRVAMNEIAVYKDTDTTHLTGQLVYAISDTDEIAPAKILAEFGKTHKAFELLGGFLKLVTPWIPQRLMLLQLFLPRTNWSPRWWLNCFPQSTIPSQLSLVVFPELFLA